MGAYTVKGLMNTSVDDCRTSMGFITDLGLLRSTLIKCQEEGHITRSKIISSRIKQLKKEGANV